SADNFATTTNIGTDSSTYVPQEADEGFQIRVVATLSDSGTTVAATSDATASVTDIAPTLSVTISGAAQEGQSLTALPVANDSDVSFAYQWQSSSDHGTTWGDISGATGKFYLVTESDETHLLRVVVTSTDSDSNQGVNGGTTATSAATAAVTDVT